MALEHLSEIGLEFANVDDIRLIHGFLLSPSTKTGLRKKTDNNPCYSCNGSKERYPPVMPFILFTLSLTLSLRLLFGIQLRYVGIPSSKHLADDDLVIVVKSTHHLRLVESSCHSPIMRLAYKTIDMPGWSVPTTIVFD